ncbi:2-hydroxychromene-2-carboxylate isomerase [Methylibium sp.]|uniref:2-hydroxychromene-2-carboxylate isomerase n=1 Tax=Methylibium sp. TaxID=2067992 RepID=UPI0033427B55
MSAVQGCALHAAATPIEFWFEFASNYSYLSVMRIEACADRRGVPVRWRPFLLGPIFRSFGWKTSPFVLQKAKGDYVWQDMARQCRKYDLAWTSPSAFPRSALLPLRVALVGAERDWIGAYCRRVMSINFGEDREIDSNKVVTEVLAALGLPARQIIDEAQSEENKLRLRQQTEMAAQRGIFGAPMFFVGEDMFWGNDRLDDALDHCVRGPA